ncbi:Transposon Ty3-I Gag-Pol polyprotein [Aphis craccivora]|uniref:Transposon Ty3-I Gag-Pol polyprotein n=1 Tax=Aphis craccivora TaxID=307492 RepID=A0A6G0VW47_APHCR|nr:Transposon Ty3-I Gag-Pol polyprotein [Aphis craccivora]
MFNPKITSGVRSCPVKTAEPPEKHRKNRRKYPRKSIENDVPVEEPQFVTMNRVNGSVMETGSGQLDNTPGKSLRIENVSDKCEDITDVHPIKIDAEQEKLTQQLLICPVTSWDLSEEFIPYPRENCKRRDSDTDSTFELRQRFSDLWTGVLESPIATVSTGKTTVMSVPLPAIELEFALGAVVELLDSQAARTYVKPWMAKKFGRSFTEELEIVRMVYGRTREITEFSEFRARIVDLEVSSRAAVLDDLIGNVFLAHDFLRNPVTPVTVGVDLTTAGFPEGEYSMWVKAVLRRYPEECSVEVGRTRVIEHQIRLKDPNPVALNAYGYSREKNEVIAEKVRVMEKQGFVEPSISPWAAPVVLVKKKDGSRRFCVDYRRLYILFSKSCIQK